MALNTKTIKRRIKSIGSTKKITKAMEMISAVKMRRAVVSAQSTRSYATHAWEMLTEIAKKTDLQSHPLLARRPIKKIAVVLITSNRGLAGGFGSRLLQATHNYIINQESVLVQRATLSETKNPLDSEEVLSVHSGQNPQPNPQDDQKSNHVQVDVILTGRAGKKIYHKFGHTVIAEFDKIDLTTKIEEILPMTQMVIDDFKNLVYDRVAVAYTDFVSPINQVPKIKQILPITEEEQVESATTNFQDEIIDTEESQYIFEPSAVAVLDVLLPRLTEMQIYQAILESDASEHSARMLAMKNASDAAGDMIKELNSSFNKARQAAITQEISEIVGGAAALG